MVLCTASCALIFISFLESHGQPALQPVGQWREHLPYQNVIEVESAGEKIFAATPYTIFSVQGDEITRYNKTTGLSEVGVNAIAWDEQTQQLVIVYANSNIDLLHNKIVRNTGDVMRSTTAGDKTIYNVYCKDGKAYLSSGLGVIVVDLLRREIADTWRIGINGAQVKVNALTNDHLFFYAASDEGLKRALIGSANLADHRQWQQMAGGGLFSGAVHDALTLRDKILVRKADSILIATTTGWQHFYNDGAWPVTGTNVSGDRLLVSQRNSTGDSRVTVVDVKGNVERVIQQPGAVSDPREAVIHDGAIWIADFFGGLLKVNSTIDRFLPNGPAGIATGQMVVSKNTLHVAAGSVNDAWNYQYNRNGIYSFTDGRWTTTNSFNTPALDTVFDFISLAVDPKDQSLWAGSYGGGLVNISGNAVKVYTQRNSTLQAAIGDPASVRVSGLAFDHHGNLWISNYGAAQNLRVRKPDGTFRGFSIPFLHNENALAQLVVDDAGQVWIVSPKGNGVFVYQPGNDLDNTNDDQWKYIRAGRGSGNLPTNNVLCLAKDKTGFIWVGTANGIAIVQCAEQVFTLAGCEAILPVVQQDRFAGFLFQNEEVRTIAVDAANRKWVGTKNGLWLISAEGDKTLYRFTSGNSPLLSNDVNNITIDHHTGEVFISTANGICSFRSTATENTLGGKIVLVFPNPVPPGYAGNIAIRGVVHNSIVKIAELNGRLVYQARASGGQAVWDGRNYKGEKVASGVYLVLAQDETGNEKTVTKIVITSGR